MYSIVSRNRHRDEMGVEAMHACHIQNAMVLDIIIFLKMVTLFKSFHWYGYVTADRKIRARRPLAHPCGGGFCFLVSFLPRARDGLLCHKSERFWQKQNTICTGLLLFTGILTKESCQSDKLWTIAGPTRSALTLSGLPPRLRSASICNFKRQNLQNNRYVASSNGARSKRSVFCQIPLCAKRIGTPGLRCKKVSNL